MVALATKLATISYHIGRGIGSNLDLNTAICAATATIEATSTAATAIVCELCLQTGKCTTFPPPQHVKSGHLCSLRSLQGLRLSPARASCSAACLTHTTLLKFSLFYHLTTSR